MSDLILGQNAGSPATPSTGKISLGYNNVSARWEGRLPNGDLVLFESSFGASVSVAQKTTLESTTSLTGVVYQSLPLNGLTIGNVYRVQWNYAWRLSSISTSFNSAVRLDATILGETMSVEPKDSGASIRIPGTIVRYFQATQVNGHVIDAVFAPATSATAEVHYGALEIWNTGLTVLPTG